MGLFDFLKKKKPVQSSSDIEQETPISQVTQYGVPAPSVKKEVVAKTPLVEISVEQDGPPPLSALLKAQRQANKAYTHTR